MDLHLDGRVAIVGGSSRGIGRAIAQALFDEGASVCISGRDADNVKAAVRDFGESDRVLGVTADLRQSEQIDAMYDRCTQRWGGVDIVVANVGIGQGSPGWDVSASEWQQLLQMNLESSVLLAQAAIPRLIERDGGSIVFVGSITGVETTSAPLAYSAAKAALHSYAKNLSRQVASMKIRVNTIAPGNVLFPGGRWEQRYEKDPAGTNDYLRSEVPMARFGTPREIADVVAFLSSDRAAFVTGACVVADGGQTHSL